MCVPLLGQMVTAFLPTLEGDLFRMRETSATDEAALLHRAHREHLVCGCSLGVRGSSYDIHTDFSASSNSFQKIMHCLSANWGPFLTPYPHFVRTSHMENPRLEPLEISTLRGRWTQMPHILYCHGLKHQLHECDRTPITDICLCQISKMLLSWRDHV